jgi:hypothetical protein
VQPLARTLSLCFAAGALGALVNSFAAWESGRAGLTAALGVSLAPAWTLAWLYPRIVWGGLWGLLFALPLSLRSWAVRGLVLSLAPAAAQLFVFLPRAGKGVLGLEHGLLTPLLVLLFDAIWGLTASAWLRWSGR